jgi:hypothetical protein
MGIFLRNNSVSTTYRIAGVKVCSRSSTKRMVILPFKKFLLTGS